MRGLTRPPWIPFPLFNRCRAGARATGRAVRARSCVAKSAGARGVKVELLCQRLNQPILKLESLEVLLDADALIAPMRAHVVDVAEGAVDAVGRDSGVAEIQIGSAAGRERGATDE